jgi:hypothetical protein
MFGGIKYYKFLISVMFLLTQVILNRQINHISLE